MGKRPHIDILVASAVLAAGVLHYAAASFGVTGADVFKGIGAASFAMALGCATLGLARRD